jgi:2-polyprenyl-3-methyl-5-hydroxy-6-metoxy-1,4-benzoquinol methylase
VKKYLPEENFSVTTIENSSFPEATFDKLQTFHVLEHVYNPKEFLIKAHNLLKES